MNPADLFSLFPYSLVLITPYIAGDFAAPCRRLATMAAEILVESSKIEPR